MAVWQAIHGDFGYPFHFAELVGGESLTFIAEHNHGSSYEREGVQTFRAGGLFESHDLVPFLPQLFQHRWQRTMHFEGDSIGTVAGNLSIKPGIATTNYPLDREAACRAEHAGEIYVAMHGSAGDDELARPLQSFGWLVAHMFEVGHIEYGR